MPFNPRLLWPDDERECVEIFSCPACGVTDVDFELLAFRAVQCDRCKATVRITHYKVSLGPPGEPLDYVEMIGVVAHLGRD